MVRAGVRTKVLVAQIQHVLGYVCGANTTDYFVVCKFGVRLCNYIRGVEGDRALQGFQSCCNNTTLGFSLIYNP